MSEKTHRFAKPGENGARGVGTAPEADARAHAALGTLATIDGKGELPAVVLEPCEDRLLVEPLEVEEKTAGGIVIPDTAKEKPRRGIVLAVGPGVRLETGRFIPTVIRPHDVVWFERHAGGEVTINEQTLRLIREGDVLARERSA